MFGKDKILISKKEETSDSVVASTNVKIAMKLEDPEETLEVFEEKTNTQQSKWEMFLVTLPLTLGGLIIIGLAALVFHN